MLDANPPAGRVDKAEADSIASPEAPNPSKNFSARRSMKFGIFIIGDNDPSINKKLNDYYDELYKEKMIMVGGPQRCIEQIEEIRETGTNYIMFLMHFAAMGQPKILRSMEIMAKEVMPRFVTPR
jgi:alkanesulfonate monooxygenase SsuD/methylene tetrahydromethanopterin reductase-like flavin-dependent oxidoreductase (luciferase family)